MCGLMGIISTEKLSKEMTSVYSTMMKLSVHRGKDSAGTLAVERKKDGLYFAVKKKAIHPDDYVRATDVKNFLSSTNHALLGHVRWATVGVVEEKTSHPYHIKPEKDSPDTELIGFHNGTIRGYKTVDDLTDSERFMKRLSSVGMKAALEELPRDSAYAFVVFNIDTGTFSFFRNDRREVFMAASKDSKTLIYASEKRIITAALEYEGLKDQFENPGLLPRNQLITFDYEGEGIKIKACSNYLSDEVIKKHEEATVVRSTAGSYVWDGSSGEWVESSRGSHRPPVPRLPAPPHRTTPQGNVLEFRKDASPKGPFPVIIYKYSPLTREVAREQWTTKVSSRLTRFWEANAVYKHEYELCKLYSIVSRGGCWVQLDESTWNFEVHLPSGKKKTISCTDDRWEGWWKVMEMLDGLWEDQADFCRSMNHKEMIISAEMLHDFNSLHSMASRFCVDKKDRPADEPITPVTPVVEEGKDEIPFEEEEVKEQDKYLSYGYQEVEVEEAEKMLKVGCMNCLEHSTINDIVYWTSGSKYVCEGCSEMVAVHLGVNMMDATIGRMKDKSVLHRFN